MTDVSKILKMKDFRNILILAGISFIFYGLSESVISFRPLPGSYPYFRAIGGIFITSGMLLHLKPGNNWFWISPIIIAAILFVIPLQSSIPVIKITSPHEGDEVNISTTVSGTISGKLPENQYMWLIVHPHTSPGNWWPQGGRINPWNGQWYMQAQFGGENDAGTKFDIAVILINGKDDEEYAEYFKTRQQGNQTVYYPMPFPASANTIYQITVTQNYSRYR